ncbi:MAG TPA: hypothetical protein VG841_07935 [Caulobacterales bacterium]|nr:hypothetical protein [Caulobacterales bacterium]
MRGVMIMVAIVGVLVAALAFAFPHAFTRLDPYSIGAFSAGLALAAVFGARLTYSPRVRRADEPVQSALNPIGPPTLLHGLTYAVIWAAILLGAAAVYSLSDWARGIGELIGAFLN